MSSRKPKKSQKFGSSRRLRDRNREFEEKENDDEFPNLGNQEHNNEQSQSHTVSESQASNESSLLHSDQPLITCTNPSTSVCGLSFDPHSQDLKDLLAQAEVTSKKRKMGSTRKGNRNFQLKEIHEDEPEHRVQLSEGVSDEQEVIEEASIKVDEVKEDRTSQSDCAASQSSEHESSIIQGKHLALGTIMHYEDDHKNDEHQNLEAALQSKPMDISASELNQSKDAELHQDILHTSLDFSIVTPTECNVAPQELDEFLQISHQVDTFSEPVAPLPNTTGQKSRTGTTYMPLIGNRDDREEVQMLKTMDEQSSLNLNTGDKQEDEQEREDVDTLEGCSAKAIGQDEDARVRSVSLINKYDHGTQDDKVATVILQNVSTKASTEDENIFDYSLEHKDKSLMLTKESIHKSKSTVFREDTDEYKEVSVAGERTDNDSNEGVATNLNHAMEPDRNIISPIKLKYQEVETSSGQLLSYEFNFQSEISCFGEEQYDLSEARCWKGGSSSDEDIVQKEVGMCHDDKEKYTAIGTGGEMENDDMQSTTSNQLFSKISSTNMLDFATESGLITAETLYGETETTSHRCNLQHNPGEFPTELEMQSEEGVCFDQMLDKVIIDSSEILGIETEVIEEKNNGIKEEINAGSTESFTKEDFIRVDNEKDGTCMNEHEMAFVITNIQDYIPVTDQTSPVVEEHVTESPVHAHPTRDSMELIPGTQFKLDMQVDNDIAVPEQKQNMSEECLINPTNRESEQFERTSPIVFIQESRLGQDDAVAENMRFSPSEKKQIDSTQRSLGLISEGDHEGSFKVMKEEIQGQSIEESILIPEEGKLSFSAETCYPQSSESLNIMEPEAERLKENMITTVDKNDNTYPSQVYNETPEHISVEVVNTSSECSVHDRQGEETVRVKNICSGVDTTHVVLSDELEHLVDTGLIKMQSRTEDAESKAQNEQTTWEGDKNGQSISLEEPHQNTYPDLELGQIKSSECTEFVTVTINTELLVTSAEPKNTAEVVQLPEANMIPATTTLIQEEAHMLISTNSRRRKMGSIRRSLGEKKDENNQEDDMYRKEEDIAFTDRSTLLGPENEISKEKNTMEDLSKSSQQYIDSDLSSQNFSSSQTAIEHPSLATDLDNFKKDDGNTKGNVERTNAEIHTQTQTKKKNKFGSTRRPHGRHQPNAEVEEGELEDPGTTGETEHQIMTQALTSNLLTEPQNTTSEVTLDVHASPVTSEQNLTINPEVEIVTGEIDAPPAILSSEVDQIHTVVSDEVSNAEGLIDISEQSDKPEVNEEKDVESVLLNEQEMAPILTKIQDDAFKEHVSIPVKTHHHESPENESASEVNAHSTCGPVELIPETQVMSDKQMDTENIHAVVSDQEQNLSEEHPENPTNRESEPEQLENTSPFVQIQQSKSAQADGIKENLEFSSSEQRRKIGSTRRRLRGQIPGSDQKNNFEAMNEKETLQVQSMDQTGSNTEVTVEETNDTKKERNAGPTENFTEENIATEGSQEYMLSELSSLTTDLGLTSIEYPSPATERPDLKEGDGNSMENVENANAEIHTQTQTKKKKKFGSTRRPHGRHQPNAEVEEGELEDPGTTGETEHQILTQVLTSNLLTEPQNTTSEVTLDVHASPVTSEQNLTINPEVEIVTGEIDAPPAILSTEVDQIHTVVSDEVSNAEGLIDISEQSDKPEVNEEKDVESVLLNEQEMAPILTKIQDDAFKEHVSVPVKTQHNESPENESVSEVNAHSTCGPGELIPETQVMSDKQMDTENIHAVVSDQEQNLSEEHPENPTNRESEPEQLESTSPFVQIQELKSAQADGIKENLEFSSSEQRRKIGSTRRRLRGQIPGSDQKNNFEAINEKETLQEQNMDQTGSNTEVTVEVTNDTKKEINAGPTENFTEENITTEGSQEFMLSELSSLTTDLGLTSIEHPSPATERPDLKEDDGNSMENVENANAEIHTQTQTKKKKKFGSTRRPHGRHQPNAEVEEGEFEDPGTTGETEHQIMTQALTSNLLTEPQNTRSEVTLDVHASPVTSEQNLTINPEVEIVTGEIDAPPAILSPEVDQIHTVVSDEVSNAEGLIDISEQSDKPEVNEEKDVESVLLNEQEMAPILTKIQDDAFKEHVSIPVKTHHHESPENESASEVNVHSTCGQVELIPETQVMSDKQMDIENIHAVVSDQEQNLSEEHPENPTNRESEPEQLESTSPFIQIQELKSAQADGIKENLEFSSSEQRRKIGSTRRRLSGQIPGSDQKNNFEPINEKETLKEQSMDQKGSNTEVTVEETNDTKKERNASPTENFTEENITTEGSQEYMLSELSSLTTDLGLTSIEHPSPATERPDLKEDDGNSMENVERPNAENHTQTQTKKKKKFGSTRRPHGRHQQHAEVEEGELEDPETTGEIEHKIMTQALTSNLLTEPQNTTSEVTLEVHASPVTIEQNLTFNPEVEILTGEIDAPPAILSTEVDQIHTVNLGLTIKHPSPATERPDLKEDDENNLENVETRNAEIHTQTQSKRKKKLGSTRRPHGRHQTHAEVEEGELEDSETTGEIEHQIMTQASTSNLLTKPQNTMSEVTLDVHDSPVTTEQNLTIIPEVEIVTGEIDAPPAILSTEVDQIHTVVSDEVSNAEGLIDISEQSDKPEVNEEKDAEFVLLNGQETAPILTKIQDDAFKEHVSIPVKTHHHESPENKSVSEVNAYSTCGPVEFIPETQVMSDKHMDIENIHAVVSDQEQNLSEEHPENPTNRESEPEQLESTGQFIQIQELRSAQADGIKENLEFGSSEQRRKIGSTRRRLRGQIPGSDQKNNFEAIIEKETLQEQNMDQKGSNTEVTVEETNDTKKEIIAGPTENFPEENITAVCLQEYMLSELSSHTTDLGLTIIEHPSPATDCPDLKEDDGNSMEHVVRPNAKSHTQTQTKKKKKFGSTRRPHGRHQPNAEVEEGELEDPGTTGEIEHKIMTQALTSNLLTEPQNTRSEVTLDVHDSPVTTEQNHIFNPEVEILTGEIDAPPAILSPEVDQIHTVNLGLTIKHPSPATERPDLKEDDENNLENVKTTNAEIHTQTQSKRKKKFGSTRRPQGRHLGDKGEEDEWKDVDDTEKIQIVDQAGSLDLLTELQHAISGLSHDILKPSLRIEQGEAYTENESNIQLEYPTHGPMKILPETETRLDMPVVPEEYHTMSEDHPENPQNRESEPEQCESTCQVVPIQELTLALDDMTTQNSGNSNSGRKKKLGSTRRSLRVTKEKENFQEQTKEESTPTSEKDHALNLTADIALESIQTHSEPLNIMEPEADKLGSTCKNLEDEQEASNDLNPRYALDINREYLKLVVIDDMLNPDSNFCDTETRVQEHEPQIHNEFDQSEDSLLSEIEFYLNKSFDSTLNSTVLNPNISEFLEPMSERSLQLPSSQNPELHMEPGSPARRRKMGSSRKMSRNKHAENLSNESRGSEQEKENLDNSKDGEPKRDATTFKKTVMAEDTEDMKESVECMSEVHTLTQINESGTQVTGQPLPEGRRRFGSRHTAKRSSGLGAFTHGDYESNQIKTDVQVTEEHLRVSDPYFISEPESTPDSEPRPGIEGVTKTVMKDPNASTEPDFVSLDHIRKPSTGVVSTGGRQKIDFEQWNEQIPDFGLAVYNIVMVGNSNVGKTSFIKRLQSGHFNPDFSATIGVDTFVQTVTFGSRTVKLYVWDTAGQERYHSITRQVFHKAQGLLLMYDITSSQSFHAVRSWISQIQENAPPDVILMLLGNKNDCAHREVQLKEGEDLSKEYNVHFMECSAATGENVSESLKTLAWLLVKQRVRKEEENTTLQPKPQNKKSGCC